MITYSTKFPVNDSLTKNEFINTIIKWNQGSKYDKINPLMWDGVSFGSIGNAKILYTWITEQKIQLFVTVES